jgi:hypothetical protein
MGARPAKGRPSRTARGGGLTFWTNASSPSSPNCRSGWDTMTSAGTTTKRASTRVSVLLPPSCAAAANFSAAPSLSSARWQPGWCLRLRGVAVGCGTWCAQKKRPTTARGGTTLPCLGVGGPAAVCRYVFSSVSTNWWWDPPGGKHQCNADAAGSFLLPLGGLLRAACKMVSSPPSLVAHVQASPLPPPSGHAPCHLGQDAGGIAGSAHSGALQLLAQPRHQPL